MAAADLRVWVSNFAVLRGKLDNYEAEADQINPNSPNRGVGQMIGFQYGTIQSMLDLAPFLPKPDWLDGEEFGPTADREHLLLASRYVLEATMQFADGASLDEARTTLRELLDRLEATARSWTENGVDAAELEQIAAERRALARRVKAAAAQANR
ncbi:hypothetical protein ACWEKT_37515 [Nocardia takedensis]